MKHIGRYQNQGVPFSAWLYRIAHNLVANWHRDNSRRKIISIDDVSQWRVSDDSPEFVTELMQDTDVLLTAIRRLPADRQELLILKFVERLPNAEIGDIMGRSEGRLNRYTIARCWLYVKICKRVRRMDEDDVLFSGRGE